MAPRPGEPRGDPGNGLSIIRGSSAPNLFYRNAQIKQESNKYIEYKQISFAIQNAWPMYTNVVSPETFILGPTFCAYCKTYQLCISRRHPVVAPDMGDSIRAMH